MAFAATKRKRIKLKRKPVQQVQLTSLIDLMTTILIFLLQTYSAVEFQVNPSEMLHLPESVNTKAPLESVQMIVAANAIVVQGKVVAEVDPATYEVKGVEPTDLVIPNLDKMLRKEAEMSKAMAARQNREFTGQITIQAHKTIPYKLLVKALVTAGKAEFGEIKFLAYKIEE